MMTQSEIWEALSQIAEQTTSIKKSADCAAIIATAIGLEEQENFMVVCLNSAHEIITTKVISIGTVNRAMVHPRDIYRVAISHNTTSIIIAHNHPSGSLIPSDEDKAITRRILDAGVLLGIPLLDHIIVSPKGYTSFVDTGIMPR